MAKADNSQSLRSPREGHLMEKSVKYGKNLQSFLAIVEAAILQYHRRTPVKALDIGEIEPVLGEIGGALSFVPFELHFVSVARKIALAIFYVLQKVKARP
jgi:hypothetical protein